jgi:hypothetical protein
VISDDVSDHVPHDTSVASSAVKDPHRNVLCSNIAWGGWHSALPTPPEIGILRGRLAQNGKIRKDA